MPGRQGRSPISRSADGFELAEDILAVWNDVAPLLTKAILRGPGDFGLTDIFHQLCDNRAQLWIFRRKGKVELACVTEILLKPRKKVLNFKLLGGMNRGHWLGFQGRVKDWANAQGCYEAEHMGREGWTRALGEEWNVQGYWMRRKL